MSGLRPTNLWFVLVAKISVFAGSGYLYLGRYRLFSLRPGKSVGELLDPAGGQPALSCGNDYAIAEYDGSPLFQAKVHRFLVFAKDLLSQRVSRKQTISPGMPVGGIAGIVRMIDDKYAERSLLLLTI